MGTISDIKSGIEAVLDTTIPNYSKLAYQVDIAMNKFKGNKKGYAVLPAPGSEVAGLIGSFSVDHSFSITLVDSYNDGARSQIGDAMKITKMSELNDDILTAYKALALNKGNIDASILVINQLSVDEAEFIDEEKVITVRFNINIKYKINK